MSGLNRPQATAEVISVIVGPDEHGVTRHAEALAGAAGIPVARYPDAANAIRDVALTCRRAKVCHWHFTDRLFGDDVGNSGPSLRRPDRSGARSPRRQSPRRARRRTLKT